MSGRIPRFVWCYKVRASLTLVFFLWYSRQVIMLPNPVVHVVEDLDIDYVALTRAVARLRSEGSIGVNLTRFDRASRLLDCYRQDARPDLLLIDLNLGDSTGFDLLESLSASPHFSQYPKVIYTSSYNPRDVERGYRMGANGYLVKPLGIDKLAKVLRGCFQYWFEVSLNPKPIGFQEFLPQE